jgi:hypothetical protein
MCCAIQSFSSALPKTSSERMLAAQYATILQRHSLCCPAGACAVQPQWPNLHRQSFIFTKQVIQKNACGWSFGHLAPSSAHNPTPQSLRQGVLGAWPDFCSYYLAALQVPVLYYLSGLTRTDENIIQKSGVQPVSLQPCAVLALLPCRCLC